MGEIRKIEIQDKDGNIYYPYTDASIVKNGNTTLDKIQSNMQYENAKGSGTAISLTMENPLVNGYWKKFIASANNDGAATTINGKPLYKPCTTNTPTLKANHPYEIYYNLSSDCFFLKASAEGNAVAANVLAGKTFSNNDDIGLTGTMPNRGAPTTTLNAGGIYNIASGYYSGGKVTVNSMSKQLSDLGSTLIDPSQLVNGVTAVDKNGNLITGTAPNVKIGSVYADTTKKFTVVKSSGTVTSYAALPIPLNKKPKFLYVYSNATSYNRELPYATFDINDFNGNRIYTHYTNGYSIDYMTFSNNSWILSDNKLYIPTYVNATDTEHPYKYIAVL